MFNELIHFFIAAACGLFVLSLPLSRTDTGATLRRWAGVCFVLALLPSLIGGLFYPSSTSSSSSTTTTTTSTPPAPAENFFSSLGRIAAVITAVFIAYGILKLRRRLASKAKPRDPWESFFNRGGGKRPFTMNPKATRARGPFGFDDDEDDD